MSAALLLGGLGLGAAGSLAGGILPARSRVPAASVLTAAGCAAAFAAAARVLASGEAVTARSAEILPLTGVTLSLDPLGAVFVITAAVAGAAASCYNIGYAAARRRGPDGDRAAAAVHHEPAGRAGRGEHRDVHGRLGADGAVVAAAAAHRAPPGRGPRRGPVVRGDDARRGRRDPARARPDRRARRRPVVRRDPGRRRRHPARGPLPRVRPRPGRVRVEGRGGPGARVAAARPSRGARARCPR